MEIQVGRSNQLNIKKTITVKGTEIMISNVGENDYISLTDIARHRDSANMDTIIQNWLRNRNTIELLGFWELMYNPDFKPIEFEGFRNKTGLKKYVKVFGLDLNIYNWGGGY
jgi:hypothetical protein